MAWDPAAPGTTTASARPPSWAQAAGLPRKNTVTVATHASGDPSEPAPWHHCTYGCKLTQGAWDALLAVVQVGVVFALRGHGQEVGSEAQHPTSPPSPKALAPSRLGTHQVEPEASPRSLGNANSPT